MSEDKGNDLNAEVVSLDLPQWMADELEQKAARFLVTSQDLVKVWIAERPDETA